MPRAPVGLIDEHLHQRAMHSVPLAQRCGLIQRRAYEWMAEADARVVDANQACCDSWLEDVRGDRRPDDTGRRRQHFWKVNAVVSGGH